MASTIFQDLQYIQQAEKIMDENLYATKGVDTSGMTLMEKANAILSPDNTNKQGYIRPSWYPDADTIMVNAPEILHEGYMYYPFALFIIREPYDTLDYSNYSFLTTSGGTMGVVFSDTINDDDYGFQKSTDSTYLKFYHKFDTTKDIVNPSDNNERVRWFIVYQRINGYNSLSLGSDNSPFIVIEELYVFSSPNFTTTQTSNANINIINCYELKYLCFKDTIKFNCSLNMSGSTELPINTRQLIQQIDIDTDMLSNISTTTSSNSNINSPYNQSYKLKAINIKDTIPEKSITVSGKGLYSGISPISYGNIIIPKQLVASESSSSQYLFNASNCETVSNLSNYLSGLNQLNGAFQYAIQLKSIEIPSGILSLINSFQYCCSLENVSLPAGLTSISGSFTSCFSLRKINLPSTLTTSITSNQLSWCTYIGLFNDFDINNCAFYYASQEEITKEEQWFKDLCVWLKDRTGVSANRMTLGQKNIAKMQKLYLTYNTQDKNDITWVDEGTADAITCLEYITNVKNWTIS